ncbi:MAG: high frequency lysogenization protein HflD [Pseudomonadales bacterium]|nr:high frequency lysogenization protein HflD [Pseudomonadales bacterium]NRA15117.1 high frequency lysogenization protein HflD [Oceanospirillaceae bacterium]
MSRNQDEQAIAVAAMFQAASLVDQIANKGMTSQSSFETSINSLFEMKPDNTEAVFGGQRFLPHNLGLGLRTLMDIVDKRRNDNSNHVTNYVLAMIMLQQKLAKNDKMLSLMAERLENLSDKALKYYSHDLVDAQQQPSANYTHTNIIAGLDGLYQDTISTFSFRIKVQGDPRHLQNKENAAKVRALLLAGIRAAILWRQVGGRRWHLLFFKSRIRQSVQKILDAN